MQQTSQKLIYIVVCTIALMAMIYVGILGWLAINNQEPPANVQQAFNHAGDICLGALIGLLVNTRVMTAPPQVEVTKLPEPVATTTK